MNLAVRVCAVKREHPVATVNKGGLYSGTLNSVKWWGCLCHLYGHCNLFQINIKVWTNRDSSVQWLVGNRHVQTSLRVHLEVGKKITLMLRPRPSVRL
jgi:hypothetical protein